MVRLKYILRDYKKRQKVYSKELYRNCLKAISFQRNLPFIIRNEAYGKLQRLGKQHPQTHVRNRCVATGRARGVYRFFRLSRFEIKGSMVLRVLPYVRKSS
jgi:small subunit ribosomal protein S14